MVHLLLKPGLENFEHYFASTWDECNCAVVWTFSVIAFLWDWNENWSVPFLWPLLSFPNLLAYWVHTLTASSFRIWNSSAGIPSPPLALFVVMLPKACWLRIPGCLVVGEWSHHCDYLGHEDLFCRKETKPVNPKGNQPWIFIGKTDAEIEALILWPPDVKSQFIRKDPDTRKDWRQGEKWATEDDMFGWHHCFNGHEFEQMPGDTEGQESLACWSPWVRKSWID